MKPLLAAFQFLTILPVRATVEERDLERAPVWFPCVGLVVGILVAAADAMLQRFGVQPALLAILSVALLAALTGGLHLDGLADTADGFLSARPRERALEIMRDSRIGTMGVLALIFVLAVKLAALFTLTGPARWHALVLAPLAGRCMLTAVMNWLPYARADGGLAAVFVRRRNPRLGLYNVLGALAASVILFGWAGFGLAIACGLATALMAAWCTRRIGGFTGDTLGATSEVIEALVLAWVS